RDLHVTGVHTCALPILERARTIGFTIPYFAFKMVVLTKEGNGIEGYADLKGRKTGSTAGTAEAIALDKDVKAWADPAGSIRTYHDRKSAVEGRRRDVGG